MKPRNPQLGLPGVSCGVRINCLLQLTFLEEKTSDNEGSLMPRTLSHPCKASYDAQVVWLNFCLSVTCWTPTWNSHPFSSVLSYCRRWGPTHGAVYVPHDGQGMHGQGIPGLPGEAWQKFSWSLKWSFTLGPMGTSRVFSFHSCLCGPWYPIFLAQV